ncbi:hypothetical protein Droror1_Dr00010455 [Drosera rotundifolia]
MDFQTFHWIRIRADLVRTLNIGMVRCGDNKIRGSRLYGVGNRRRQRRMPRFFGQYPPAMAEIKASRRFRVLGEGNRREKEGGEEKKMARCLSLFCRRKWRWKLQATWLIVNRWIRSNPRALEQLGVRWLCVRLVAWVSSVCCSWREAAASVMRVVEFEEFLEGDEGNWFDFGRLGVEWIRVKVWCGEMKED